MVRRKRKASDMTTEDSTSSEEETDDETEEDSSSSEMGDCFICEESECPKKGLEKALRALVWRCNACSRPVHPSCGGARPSQMKTKTGEVRTAPTKTWKCAPCKSGVVPPKDQLKRTPWLWSEAETAEQVERFKAWLRRNPDLVG